MEQSVEGGIHGLYQWFAIHAQYNEDAWSNQLFQSITFVVRIYRLKVHVLRISIGLGVYLSTPAEGLKRIPKNIHTAFFWISLVVSTLSSTTSGSSTIVSTTGGASGVGFSALGNRYKWRRVEANFLIKKYGLYIVRI